MLEEKPRLTPPTRIKGGVITMGSLFWENGRNCLKDKTKLDCNGRIKSVELAKYRTEWRDENFEKSDSDETRIRLPIRYGKKSDTRKDTYTMVFSREYLNRDCFARIIPFKNEIDFQRNGTLVEQTRKMAKAEGITDRQGNVHLAMDWCVMAIWIKPNATFTQYLKTEWLSIVNPPNNHFRKKNNPQQSDRNATDYSGHNDLVLLNNDFELIDVPINCSFDFLLLTYTKPTSPYPADAETIANAINHKNSRYNSYLSRNIKNDIITCDDNSIRGFLLPSLQF